GFWLLPAVTILELAWIPILIAVFRLAGTLRGEQDAAARSDVRRALVLFALPPIVAIVAHALSPQAARGAGSPLLTAAQVFWGISLPVLLTYALLKHQLFDIELKV